MPPLAPYKRGLSSIEICGREVAGRFRRPLGEPGGETWTRHAGRGAHSSLCRFRAERIRRSASKSASRPGAALVIRKEPGRGRFAHPWAVPLKILLHKLDRPVGQRSLVWLAVFDLILRDHQMDYGIGTKPRPDEMTFGLERCQVLDPQGGDDQHMDR